MESSNKYDPIIAVAPYHYESRRDWRNVSMVMNEACAFCEKKQYHYLLTYQDGHWVDVKKIFNPDIVFFSFPQRFCTYKYYIYHFLDKLTLYCQYATPIVSDYKSLHDKRFHNLLWRNLAFTEYHHSLNITYSRCHGDNSVVIGLLPAEKLIDQQYNPSNVWKEQPFLKKKIIWAPHHTVGEAGSFVMSTFLEYSHSMIDIAEHYQDQIQIAFKPHPALFSKLVSLWGENRTREYYDRWKMMGNGQLEEGDYIDLFLTSDAMIHDCGGFRVQYLCTRKPVMYLMHSDKIYGDSNEFGKQCLDLHYHGYSENDIETFINRVVVGGDDPLRQQRESFFDKNIKFRDGKTPSERILDIISTSVWG